MNRIESVMHVKICLSLVFMAMIITAGCTGQPTETQRIEPIQVQDPLSTNERGSQLDAMRSELEEKAEIEEGEDDVEP